MRVKKFFKNFSLHPTIIVLICCGFLLAILFQPIRASQEEVGNEAFDFMASMIVGQEYHPESGRELLQISKLTDQDRRFCGMSKDSRGDALSDCDWPKYIQVVLSFAAGGLVMMGLSCCSCPVFLCGRFCCNCFGGKHRSPGILCPGERNEFEGYTFMHMMVLRVGLILVACLVLVSIIIGFVGNAKVDKGVGGLIDATIGTAGELFETIQRIQRILESLPPPPNFDFEGFGNQTDGGGGGDGDGSFTSFNFSDTFGPFNEQGQQIRDTAKTVEKVIRQINSGRTASVYVSLLIPAIIFAIGGVLGGIFRMTKAMMITAILFFFCSALIWFSMGFHGTLTILTQDVCLEWEIFLENNSNANETNPALSTFLSCVKGDGPGGLLTEVLAALDTFSKEACNATNSLCDNPGFICTYHEPNCTRGSIERKVSSMIILDTNCTAATINDTNCFFTNRTLAECATSCFDSSFRNASIAMNETLVWFTTFETIIYDEIIPLFSCGFLAEAFEKLEKAFCDDVSKGLDLITTGLVIFGISMFFATIGYILGYKRFMVDKDKSYYDNNEMNPY